MGGAWQKVWRFIFVNSLTCYSVTVHGQNGGEGDKDGVDHPPNRGFGKGYESFPEELHTEIDVAKLIHHLKESGIEVCLIIRVARADR